MKVAVSKATHFVNDQFEATLGFIHHSTTKKGVYLYYTDGQLLKYNLETKKTEQTTAKLPADLTRFRVGTLTDTKIWILDGNDKKLKIFNLETLKFEAQWAAPSETAKKEANANDDAKIEELLMDTKVLAMPKHGLIITMERIEKNANDCTFVFTAYDQNTNADNFHSQHKIGNNKNFVHFDAISDDAVAIFTQEIESNAADIPYTVWHPITRADKTYALKNSEKIVGTIVNIKELSFDGDKKRLGIFVNTESADATKPDEAIVILTELGTPTIERIEQLKNVDQITKQAVPCLIHNVIHVYPKDQTLLGRVVEDGGNKIILYNYAKHLVLAAFNTDDETDAAFSIIEQTLIQSPQILADPPKTGSGSNQETSFLTTLFIPKEVLSIFYMLNAREKAGGQTLGELYKGVSIVSDAYNLLAERVIDKSALL